MIPSLDLGPLSFPSYFTLLTIGFMVAIWLGWREGGKIGIDQDRLLDLGLVTLIGGLVGSRILHVFADGYFWDYVYLCTDPFQLEGKKLTSLIDGKHMADGWPCISDYVCQVWERGDLCNPADGRCYPGRDCLRVFKIWYGGFAYYGGFLFAFLASLWFVWRKKMPVWKTADVTGFGIALGLVFGRIGCFLAGCCYGKLAHGFPGLRFPNRSPAWSHHVEVARDVRWFVSSYGGDQPFWSKFANEHIMTDTAGMSPAVHPTQLYSVIANAIVFGVCYWMFKRRRTYDGKVFWWFIVLYAIGRFVTEFWRDDARGVWFGETISTSQLIGLPLLALAFFMMWFLKRRSARQSGVGSGGTELSFPPEPGASNSR